MGNNNIFNNSQLLMKPNFKKASLEDIRELLDLMNFVVVINDDYKQDPIWVEKVSNLEKKGSLILLEQD